MEKQGEAREKVLSVKRGKTRGEESRCRSPLYHQEGQISQSQGCQPKTKDNGSRHGKSSK